MVASALRSLTPFVAHPPPRDPADHLAWNARQWNEIAIQIKMMQARLEFIIENFTFAGHASLQLNAPVALPNLTSAWVRLKPWQIKGSELYAVASLPNGSMDILVAGTWLFTFSATFNHNELNQARNMRMRLVNATTTVPIGANTVSQAVPRDTPQTRYVYPFLFDATLATALEPVAVEISMTGAETLTGLSVVQSSWSLANVGVWLGDIPSGGVGFRR